MPRDSRLPPHDVERFYRIWWSILSWVNEREGIAPGAEPPYAPRTAASIRDSLWGDDSLRYAWIDENPDGMPPEDLALVQSWDHRVAGPFTVIKHYAGHSVFLGQKGRAFAVLGLTDPLRELLPGIPTYIRIVLLPNEGRITYDGLIEGYAISLGAGIRRSLTSEFRLIQERGELCHSLEPGAARSPVDDSKVTKKANRSVLADYRRHLTAQGHSQSIRARDIALAEWLAERVAPGRSLARLDKALVKDCVRSTDRTPVPRAQFFTSLKRFVVFLGQSERMDWKVADDVHRWLRTQGRQR